MDFFGPRSCATRPNKTFLPEEALSFIWPRSAVTRPKKIHSWPRVKNTLSASRYKVLLTEPTKEFWGLRTLQNHFFRHKTYFSRKIGTFWKKKFFEIFWSKFFFEKNVEKSRKKGKKPKKCIFLTFFNLFEKKNFLKFFGPNFFFEKKGWKKSKKRQKPKKCIFFDFFQPFWKKKFFEIFWSKIFFLKKRLKKVEKKAKNRKNAFFTSFYLKNYHFKKKLLGWK